MDAEILYKIIEISRLFKALRDIYNSKIFLNFMMYLGLFDYFIEVLLKNFLKNFLIFSEEFLITENFFEILRAFDSFKTSTNLYLLV